MLDMEKTGGALSESEQRHPHRDGKYVTNRLPLKTWKNLRSKVNCNER
jgi:hypothetical protein